MDTSHDFIPASLMIWFNGLSDDGKDLYRRERERQEAQLASPLDKLVGISEGANKSTILSASNGNLMATSRSEASPRIVQNMGSGSFPKISDVLEPHTLLESESLDLNTSHVERANQSLVHLAVESTQAFKAIIRNSNDANQAMRSTSIVPYDAADAVSEAAQPEATQTTMSSILLTGSNLSNSSFSGRTSYGGTSKRIPLSIKRKQRGGTEQAQPQDRGIGSFANSMTLEATPLTETGPSSEFATLPKWYRRIDCGARAKFDRSVLLRLNAFRELIRRSKTLEANTTQENLFDEMRNELHKLEYLKVDEVTVKKSKLLEPSTGLPHVFAPPGEQNVYPYDIVADSRALYNKWRRQDFDPNILRGLHFARKIGKSRQSVTLDPNYPNRISPNEFGDNDLVNGQWFPILLAALRDGAHGATQAGIHGKDGQGAFSVLVSNKDYADKDEGDVLLYCGTEGEGGETTNHTQRLFESHRNKMPVRVLRTANLPVNNPYRPAIGYRYDGLYDVVGSELLDQQKSLYRFRLERQRGQGPIRYRGLEARPSAQDIEAYNNHKGLMR